MARSPAMKMMIWNPSPAQTAGARIAEEEAIDFSYELEADDGSVTFNEGQFDRDEVRFGSDPLLATSVADAAPLAVQALLKASRFAEGIDRGVLARQIFSSLKPVMQSDDAAEGVQSFLEKRPAEFPGKVSADMPEFFPWWEEPRYE